MAMINHSAMKQYLPSLLGRSPTGLQKLDHRIFAQGDPGIAAELGLVPCCKYGD
jgi:hypothetical protein